MTIPNGSIAVDISRTRHLVRLRMEVDTGPHGISCEMSPDDARELAARLIDAAARADGIDMPPLCRCAAGERTGYEICRECNDGDRYEGPKRPGGGH